MIPSPPNHPALDYELLRTEGVRHLEELAGHVWTDFNAHDPGVTILEQLCYALTDLGYRASYDLPDLLAGGGGSGLFSAAAVLTSQPVTPLDLRKVVLDVEGVKNAWVEAITEPKPPLYFHEGEGELRFQPEPPYTVPVQLKGLYRVLVEASDLVDRDRVQLRQEVVHRLHACRPLCADFEEIRVLDVQPVQVQAEIEIGPVDDAESVLLEVFQALDEHVSPSVHFDTLAERLATGRSSDEIFDGPSLEHGFLESAALSRLERRGALYTSDLIRLIMGVPGVRAVRAITLSAGGKPSAWKLALDEGRTPRLDLHASPIVLVKGRLRANLDVATVIKAYNERRRRAAAPIKLDPRDRDLEPPRGRDRKVDQYHSIQHQLPAAYGVGELGLPDSASPERKAQAKQLKAYLSFFEQLMANYLAQLARAASLLSLDDEGARTYFAQPIDDPTLGLDEVWRLDVAGHRARLDELAEGSPQPERPGVRKGRFLNHLMARFAERLTDYSLVGADGGTKVPTDEQLGRDKLAFLKAYPRISGARGTGFDCLSPKGGGNVSGLEDRIRLKLGLNETERFVVIEHLLLRPLEEDVLPPGEREYHPPSLLAESASGDPYSLQLSFVFAGGAGRFGPAGGAGGAFRVLVEQVVREETPAHLTPYVHWLSEDEWSTFEPAYLRWLDMYREYRASKLGV